MREFPIDDFEKPVLLVMSLCMKLEASGFCYAASKGVVLLMLTAGEADLWDLERWTKMTHQTVYSQLRAWEKQGKVQKRKEQNRCFYSLTDEGRELVEGLVGEFQEQMDARVHRELRKALEAAEEEEEHWHDRVIAGI